MIVLVALGGCDQSREPARKSDATTAAVPTAKPNIIQPTLPTSCLPVTPLQGVAQKLTGTGSGGMATAHFIAVPGKNFVHGVDVSRNAETADFAQVQECGGSFIYVRLSYGIEAWTEDRWRPLWLRAAQEVSRRPTLVRGGYHVLSFSAPTKRVVLQRSREWVGIAQAEARAQAQLFVSRLEDVLKSSGDSRMLPVALLIDGADMPDIGAARELYRYGACAWFGEVQSRFHSQMTSVVLGAQTALLQELKVADLSCPGVAPIKLWLVQYTGDGGEPSESSWSFYRECAETRHCLFHKYTSRGQLTLAGDREFVGLDRFLGDRVQFESVLIEVRQ